MSESKEPKVTECWVEEGFGSNGHPTLEGAYDKEHDWYRPAILMWKEDYDAMIFDLESERRWAKQYFDEAQAMQKELEELRKRCRYNLAPGAQVTNWDEYERVRKELEELRVENKRLLDAYASEKLLNGAVAGAPLKLFSK